MLSYFLGGKLNLLAVVEKWKESVQSVHSPIKSPIRSPSAPSDDAMKEFSLGGWQRQSKLDRSPCWSNFVIFHLRIVRREKHAVVQPTNRHLLKTLRGIAQLSLDAP